MPRRPWLREFARFAVAVAIGIALAAAALAVGLSLGRPVGTFTVMGASVVFEAQPAAAVAVGLGYPRLGGAAVAVLTNLACIPIIFVGLDTIVTRWPWARRHVEKAERRSQWFLKYGPWMFIPVGPLIGAYAATALGRSLGFRPLRTLLAVVGGMIWSVLVIVYGGHWVLHLFLH